MKTCRNCKEYWWCKDTWSDKEKALGNDRDMEDCPTWKFKKGRYYGKKQNIQ